MCLVCKVLHYTYSRIGLVHQSALFFSSRPYLTLPYPTPHYLILTVLPYLPYLSIIPSFTLPYIPSYLHYLSIDLTLPYLTNQPDLFTL